MQKMRGKRKGSRRKRTRRMIKRRERWRTRRNRIRRRNRGTNHESTSSFYRLRTPHARIGLCGPHRTGKNRYLCTNRLDPLGERERKGGCRRGRRVRGRGIDRWGEGRRRG